MTYLGHDHTLPWLAVVSVSLWGSGEVTLFVKETLGRIWEESQRKTCGTAPPMYFFFFFFCDRIISHSPGCPPTDYVAKDDNKLLVLLPPPPKGRDYTTPSLCSAKTGPQGSEHDWIVLCHIPSYILIFALSCSFSSRDRLSLCSPE